MRPQWTGETVTQSPEEMRHKKGLCVTDRLYTRVYCRKNEKLTVQAFPVRLMSTHTPSHKQSDCVFTELYIVICVHVCVGNE